MKTRKGFTIVELVVVIAVIAILAAVLIPSFSGIVEKTEKSTALKLAEAAYKEARAAANEDGSITEGEVFGANGFNFRFDAGAATAEVVAYPDGYKYIIVISADTLSIFGERGIDWIPPVQDVPDTMSIDLYRKNITLSSGQSEILFAAVTPAYATGYTVEWSVPDGDAYISVDENGRITAVDVTPENDPATVTATLKVNGEVKDFVECLITVVPVGVSNITLNKINTSLGLGENETLIADIKPADAVYSGIEWSSSDESVVTVVTVDGNGEIKAVDFGNAVITAKVGDKTASCGVTVCGIKLTGDTSEIAVGEKLAIKVETYPVGAKLEWSSNDPYTVSVDSNGVVTGLSESATAVNITAEFTLNGKEYTATYPIKVLDRADVLGIAFASGEGTTTSTTLPRDKTLELVATNLPSELEIEWQSSASEIARVSGNTVTPVGPGTTAVTATVKIGETEYKATCNVTVPYNVTKIEQNATITGMTFAIPGSSYTASISIEQGYELNSVVIIMGETDITSTAYDEHTSEIMIDNVTGDLKIQVIATAITHRVVFTDVIKVVRDEEILASGLEICDGDPFEAKVVRKDNYAITKIEVRMGGEPVEIVDGLIWIGNVTGDIDITVETTPNIAEISEAGSSNKFMALFDKEKLDVSKPLYIWLDKGEIIEATLNIANVGSGTSSDRVGAEFSISGDVVKDATTIWLIIEVNVPAGHTVSKTDLIIIQEKPIGFDK